MRAVIHGERILRAEETLPSPHTHYSAAPVMVMDSEKGMEVVLAPGSRRIREGTPPEGPVFSHGTESEMKFLPVADLGPVDSVKDRGHSRQQGKKRKIADIQRGIQ